MPRLKTHQDTIERCCLKSLRSLGRRRGAERCWWICLLHVATHIRCKIANQCRVVHLIDWKAMFLVKPDWGWSLCSKVCGHFQGIVSWLLSQLSFATWWTTYFARRSLANADRNDPTFLGWWPDITQRFCCCQIIFSLRTTARTSAWCQRGWHRRRQNLSNCQRSARISHHFGATSV